MYIQEQIQKYLKKKKSVWTKATYSAESSRINMLVQLGFPIKDLTFLLEQLQERYKPYTVETIFRRMKSLDEEAFNGQFKVAKFMSQSSSLFRGNYIGRRFNPTNEQVTTILDFAAKRAPDLYNYLFLLSRCALRKSEAMNLKWTDIDPNGFLLVYQGKGRKDRALPFSQEQRSKLLPNKSLYVIGSVRHLDKKLWIVKQGTGINFTPHALRAFALQFYSEALTLKELQDYAGHNSIATTMKYLTVDKKAISDKIDKLTSGGI